MKKVLLWCGAAVVLLTTGVVVGIFMANSWNLASVEFRNRSSHPIMTAIVSHEKGSVIAANIKKNRTQRVRFYTRGQNHYTVRVTFDDNRTIYSQVRRPVKNGVTVQESISDSAIIVENR